MRSLALIVMAAALVAACANSTQRSKKSSSDDDEGSGGFGGSATTTVTSGGGDPSTTTTATTGVTTTTTTVATTNVATSTTSGGNCFSDPDCPNCLCNQDPVGCTDYIDAVIDNIYCGQTCSTPCGTFCSSQDPNQITFACEDCVNFDVSQSDIDAFQNECSASVDCSNFLNQLFMCP